MPLIKPISGHTTTKNVRLYLTKDGRALAADYINLKYDSLLQRGGDVPIAYDWASDMDKMRVANHGDDPWQGKKARTYKHYIVSPDPKDNISLERLRELAVAWAHQNFGDYQIAIIYHDDNESRIPHAHVVVNNINLATGHRLQDPKPDELNRCLQRMADERSLRSFGKEEEKDGFQARAAAKTQRKPPLTRQDIYIRKAEAEISAKGGYSWLSDMRARVMVARGLSCNEAEFKDVLSELGVDISDNSSKADRKDWVYSFSDKESQRVTGEKLGLAFGRESLLSWFMRTDVLPPGPESRAHILTIANSAIEVADLDELHKLADVLRVNARYEIDCLEDYERAIDDVVSSANTDRENVEEIAAARQFAIEKQLLPRQLGSGSSKRIYSYGSSSSSATWDGTSEVETGGTSRRSREERQRDDRER